MLPNLTDVEQDTADDQAIRLIKSIHEIHTIYDTAHKHKVAVRTIFRNS
jgi:hypothetical protein